MAALKAYAASAAEEGGWDRYRDEKVGPDEAHYLAQAGGIEAISKLPFPIF
jgi:glutaconate CoA-transferase subunit A